MYKIYGLRYSSEQRYGKKGYVPNMQPTRLQMRRCEVSSSSPLSCSFLFPSYSLTLSFRQNKYSILWLERHPRGKQIFYFRNKATEWVVGRPPGGGVWGVGAPYADVGGWREIRGWQRIQLSRAGAQHTLRVRCVSVSLRSNRNPILHFLSLVKVVGSKSAREWLGSATLICRVVEPEPRSRN